MSHTHAVVWLDTKEAHVFQFNAEDVERQRIKAHMRRPARSIKRRASSAPAIATTTRPISRASSRRYRAPPNGWSPDRGPPRTNS